MPVGVPKVAYLIPGDEEATWVDVYNALYRQRMLFLCQAVETEISNTIVAIMVFLHIEDETLEQCLFINSPGGSVIPGIAVYDTIQFVTADVTTVCVGLAASMGSFILSGGAFDKRCALPNARVMLHQPTSKSKGLRSAVFLHDMGELLTLRESIAITYSQRTGQPFSIITCDMQHEVTMTAKEAKKYGIIDHIGIRTTLGFVFDKIDDEKGELDELFDDSDGLFDDSDESDHIDDFYALDDSDAIDSHIDW
uniref:clp protease proteolytic subunit n=1 Tax=Filipendula auriculata TaxID=3015786 RepID=UPI0023F595A8|nr:clp protease proteolytic subunit [Filipendula auriculata]YP_010726925.1 clp protease proteolytic subunit [Filipendula multijuga]YP_010727005.1 clp protease proteolytic subunit [Filipendula palmata]YP_010727165.1 clp protease proteolytic subunit [Filipendula intermedia]YP_010727325.1 clp protease proteolytic subunit [Filipendula ulmaria]YP_010727405.1 clp protease proteolytic subunit [Filipendula angustiloba]WDZ66428.1 clp protease proteolytic subunit [Filipendula auriculata]WDZ66506.1 clp